MASKLKRLPTEWEKKSLPAIYIRQGTANQNIQGTQKNYALKKSITQ
jgi:hypothetical protein